MANSSVAVHPKQAFHPRIFTNESGRAVASVPAPHEQKCERICSTKMEAVRSSLVGDGKSLRRIGRGKKLATLKCWLEVVGLDGNYSGRMIAVPAVRRFACVTDLEQAFPKSLFWAGFAASSSTVRRKKTIRERVTMRAIKTEK